MSAVIGGEPLPVHSGGSEIAGGFTSASPPFARNRKAATKGKQQNLTTSRKKGNLRARKRG